MEVTIIQNDRARCVRIGKSDIIVKDEFEGGIAEEVALHLDASIDRWVNDVARGVEQYVDLLVDVDEDLVLVGLAIDRYAGGWRVDRVRAEEGEIADFFEVQDGAWFGLYNFAGD